MLVVVLSTVAAAVEVADAPVTGTPVPVAKPTVPLTPEAPLAAVALLPEDWLIPIVPLTERVGKSVHVVLASSVAVATTVVMWWALLVKGMIEAVVTTVLPNVTEGPGVAPTQIVLPLLTE